LSSEGTRNDRFLDLLSTDGRDPVERGRLVRLMLLLADLPPPPDPLGLFPEYGRLRDGFLAAASGSDGEALEEAFLALYAHLHGHEAPYTPDERARVDETGGYWCHAGGLSPILKAAPWIGPDTVSADFGAGNGLQTLLMQRLYPHARTVQIEISSRMVEAGRELRGWLSIPDDRVEWIVGDVMDVTPEGMDFIYIYRPVRPEGPGRAFYARFAAAIERSPRPVVVFSIADCLRTFLPPAFEVFYSDGHLTCFRGPVR
jgi:hypothetical protein